jgi:hypothetical protein
MEAPATSPDANTDSSQSDPIRMESNVFEPFPKPRLYPEHWDLSEFQEKPKLVLQPSASSCGHEPFPKLRTFPGGWNLE